MKIKFCDYIKTAKVGDIFFEPVDGLKYIIIGGNKKKTFAIEICRDKSETVEWSNEDKDKIIPTT